MFTVVSLEVKDVLRFRKIAVEIVISLEKNAQEQEAEEEDTSIDESVSRSTAENTKGEVKKSEYSIERVSPN